MGLSGDVLPVQTLLSLSWQLPLRCSADNFGVNPKDANRKGMLPQVACLQALTCSSCETAPCCPTICLLQVHYIR